MFYYISPHSVIRTFSFGLFHQPSIPPVRPKPRERNNSLIILPSRRVLYLPHCQHALYHPSKYHMFVIEEFGGSASDEELTAVCIWA